VGKKGGAVVDHIYEEDLMRLQIPIIPDNIITELQEKYLLIKELREDANDLIQESNHLVEEYNNLPVLNIKNSENLDEEREIPVRLINSGTITDSYRLDGRFFNPLAELANKNIVNYATSYSLLQDLTLDIIIGKRFKRNYVDSKFGTPFIGSKNILQTRPGELKYLSNSETGFIKDIILEKNFILIACSGSLGGTFGKSCFVYKNYEGFAASQHILRVIPDENKVDPAYLFAFLSSEYGYTEIVRFRYGALIDEIDDENMKEVLVPLCAPKHQKIIGDKIRLAYEKRAEAIRLEDEAQGMLKKSLTK
jgi:type I restriction enzyme S subunit